MRGRCGGARGDCLLPLALSFVAVFLAMACARGEGTSGDAAPEAGGSPATSGGAGDHGPIPGAGRGRVVVFGIDGADWRVIDPLIAAGRMPSLARVVREGSSGILMSMEPSASPALWTTIATGVTPDRHGIHNFVVSANGTEGSVPLGEGEAGPAGRGEPAGAAAPADAQHWASWGEMAVRPVTSAMRRAPAFWNILGRFDRRAGVVGWLVTWPAEPVNGYIVSSYLPYVYNWSTGRPLKGTLVEGIPHQTFPEGLVDEVEPLKVRPQDLDAALLRRFFDPASVVGLLPSDQECVTGFRWSLACDETYRHIGRRLFARYPVDLFAVYFGGVDVASHRFWKFAHPEALDYRVRPADAAALGGVIDAYYQHVDGILGEYLADLGTGDTLVVLSDHGFQPVWDPAKPATSGHHRLEGIIALWGRGVARGGRVEHARLVDVLPTLLLLLDVPVAATLEGQPLLDALDGGFVRAHPVRRVADYGPATTPERPDVSDLDNNVLERLRSLGYIR
jgi:type I phosphodiesterase/nucleotide pyrophosphatase